MLRDILTKDEIDEIAVMHKKALNNLSILFNNEKPKFRYKYLFPIKNAGFSLKEAKKYGFKASKKLWSSCSINTKRNPGGRPKLKGTFLEKILEHLKNNSSIAANRFLKKEKANARYMSLTFRQAFDSFVQKDQMVLSTFKKYTKNIFKKPHRLSDLCDYCEQGKVFKIFYLKRLFRTLPSSLPNKSRVLILVILIKTP